MRIGINGEPLHNASGIGCYTRNLINAISLIDKENAYFLLVSRMNILPATIPSNFTLCKIKTPLFRTQIGLPLEVASNKINVYHGQNYLPFFRPCKTVLTIHDLSFERFPQFYPKKTLVYYRAFIQPSCRIADRIIAVSENTKNDIAKFYRIEPDRISVIREAPPEIFMPSENRAILEKYNIKKPYILHVGNVTLLRNLKRVIESFANLKKEKKVPHEFVVAGIKSWPYEDVESLPEKLGIKDAVKFIGYLREDELPAVYAQAELFVRVSIYEGFGIPLLEAMKCGTPVVASDAASIPEVVGDAAVLVDPYSVTDIQNGIYKVISSDAAKSDLRSKGFKRAQEFSWRRAAEQTVQVYRAAFSGR